MKVTLHLFNDCYLNSPFDWYWVIKPTTMVIVDDIVGVKDYKLKSSAIRAAKAFAEKHNFEIIKEFENE